MGSDVVLACGGGGVVGVSSSTVVIVVIIIVVIITSTEVNLETTSLTHQGVLPSRMTLWLH